MTPTLRLLLLLAITLGSAACGDAESAAAPPAPALPAAPASPWDEIPPEELYGAGATENIRLTQVEIEVLDLPRGWDGIRIAAISDLQLGLWEENERVAAAAVQRAIAARPDLIVLLGDYVAVGDDMEALERVLAPLRDRPVMAILGDRDVRSDSARARVTRTLSGLGIRLLVNDAASFSRNGDEAWVAGINPEFATRSIADQEFILATVGGPVTPLLLTHNPLLAARSPTGRRGAILAGNTFCGQVEVPGTPRLSWYNTVAIPNAPIPGAERLYRLRENTMFITCGVGYSFVPVRLSHPPEVVLLTLRGVGIEPVDQVDPDAAALDTILQRYEVVDSPAVGTRD